MNQEIVCKMNQEKGPMDQFPTENIQNNSSNYANIFH